MRRAGYWLALFALYAYGYACGEVDGGFPIWASLAIGLPVGFIVGQFTQPKEKR